MDNNCEVIQPFVCKTLRPGMVAFNSRKCVPNNQREVSVPFAQDSGMGLMALKGSGRRAVYSPFLIFNVKA